MKSQIKILLIFLILFFQFPHFFSQTDSAKKEFHLYDKGKNFVGLGISGGWGAGRPFGTINPSYGQFILKNLAIGINSIYAFNGLYYYNISAGPILRYYILNKKFTPFVDAMYNFSYGEQSNGIVKSSPLSQYINFKTQTTSIGIGLSFIAFKRIGIETKIRYTYLVNMKIRTHQWYQPSFPNNSWVQVPIESTQQFYSYRNKIWWDILNLKIYF